MVEIMHKFNQNNASIRSKMYLISRFARNNPLCLKETVAIRESLQVNEIPLCRCKNCRGSR